MESLLEDQEGFGWASPAIKGQERKGVWEDEVHVLQEKEKKKLVVHTSHHTGD